MAKKENTINYAWVISSMESRLVEGDLTDVVINVNWRRTAQTSNSDIENPTTVYYADVYGQVALSNPDPTTFVPYADLTQAYIETNWLDTMEDPTVAEMDENLANNIALQENPVDATLPLPWSE
tara:strand:- start:3288 stop:3659 length:372 start_codon:yes stop_codon:yes gene_type:complete